MTDRDPGLDPGERALVRLSAALASEREGARSGAMDEAARAVEAGALEKREVEEAVLQSYLFLGFPAALAALEDWRERLPEAGAEKDPLAGPAEAEAWTRRGREVCRRVYGRAYGPLRRKVARLHPALGRWMITEGYGKVLGRPGLGLGRRELCVVALLVVAGREPQLHSHLRGALNVGVPAETVEEALETALGLVPGAEARRRAREVWRRVRRRAGSRS